MVGLMRKIKLEKWTEAKDADGKWVESVESTDNLFAEVKFLSGSRESYAGQTNVSGSVRFKIRHKNLKVVGKWKVVYNGKRYSITSIQRENEKKFYWILTADGQH